MDESQEVFVEDSIKTYGEILAKVTATIPMRHTVRSIELVDEPDSEIVLSPSDYKDITTTIYIGLQRAEERFAKQGNRTPQGSPPQQQAPTNERASDKQIGYIKYLATNRKQWPFVNDELAKMKVKLEELTVDQARHLIDALKTK